MAGLVPAISLRKARSCAPYQDRRDKPGDDDEEHVELIGVRFSALTACKCPPYVEIRVTDVLVVGAGPVGLTLAAELARHGTRCRIIDKLPQLSPYCRAIGVTPRTLEVWDDMGIARTMIDAGIWIKGLRSIVHPHAPKDELLEFDDLPYSELGLPQYETERLLSQHLNQYGLKIERGVTAYVSHAGCKSG